MVGLMLPFSYWQMNKVGSVVKVKIAKNALKDGLNCARYMQTT